MAPQEEVSKYIMTNLQLPAHNKYKIGIHWQKIINILFHTSSVRQSLQMKVMNGFFFFLSQSFQSFNWGADKQAR